MKLVRDRRFLLGLYASVGLVVGIQKYLLGPDRINNFIIFQHSVFHFFDHLNPYPEYPKEYFDVFLYNPSFIVLFIPFAYLPHFLGVGLWTMFVAVVYYLGVNTLPFPQKSKVFLFYLIIPEMVTSLGNLQTNPLIAAFTVLTFTLLERGEGAKAALFPPLNFFIKGYGAVAGVFFLLKKPKVKTFAWLALFFVAVGSLPLIFYSWEDFLVLYQQWLVSLRDDYSINTGLSAMGLVRSLIYAEASIPLIQLTGVVFFLATLGLIAYKRKYEEVKFQFLAYVMIWMIIFNQAAESATYIIAATGVFIWYTSTGKTRLNVALFVLFMVLTVFSMSDIFPKYLRETYVKPYNLKALPTLLIWLRIQWDLLRITFTLPDAPHGSEMRSDDSVAHL